MARILTVAVNELNIRSARSEASFSVSSNQIRPGTTHDTEPHTSAVSGYPTGRTNAT